jgi:hypothetical protein
MKPRLRVVFSKKLGCYGVRNLNIDSLIPVYDFQNGEQWVVEKGIALRRISLPPWRHFLDKLNLENALPLSFN